MTRRLVTGALALGALAAPPMASAQSTAEARLQGTFQLAGRVTTAVNVRGERRGQTFTRLWTFTPQCAAGPCATVLLSRPRAGGTDTVTLIQTSPGHYAGSAQFYVGLRCAGRLYPQGELVPFRVTVAVTTAVVASDGTAVAGRINAGYTNSGRTNLTPCVEPPSHDAASYHGHVIQPG